MQNPLGSTYTPLPMRTVHEESVSLLTTEGQTSNDSFQEKLDADSEYTLVQPRVRESSSWSFKWLNILVLTLVLVDITAYLYIARLLLVEDDPPLPIRNTYVGLSDLYAAGKANTSSHPSIENRPRIDAQISLSEPKKVFPVDRLRHLTSLGRMSPPDLRLKVTDDIHTIVQFRVIDYGMERCQLAIRLPPRDINLPEPFVFPSGMNALHLDVCKLDAPDELDPFTLSYNTRPRCVDQVGTMVVSPGGEAKLPEFPCKWSEHHAFEISCAQGSPGCVLDVRATQYITLGAFMYQHQTI